MTPVFLLLLACGDKAVDSGEDAVLCDGFYTLDLPARARPGELVATGFTVDPEAAWTIEVDAGELSEDGSLWTLPADVGVHVDQALELRATVTPPGCPSEPVAASLTVGFEEADRVVVVYNPVAEGSDAVAQAYADLHGLPKEQVCGIAADCCSTSHTLDGEQLPTFLDALQACIDRVGPQVHYIVPVYGVPYKVSGVIDDISGSGAKATVSLDALMVFGAEGASLTAALYNPLYQDGNSKAGRYDDYVPFGELRQELDFDAYLVSRIEGVDADAAIALVDRNAEAWELARQGLLDGIVYVDGRYGDEPPATDAFGSYESGEWNMWGTRTLFEELGWYEVVWDGNAEEFGTAPAPTDCPDALYYAGWYSYYNYNDCFSWAPGAIGGHLDSCSACELRAEGTWSGSALIDGISFTFGAVNEPYVAGMPEYDQLFLYLSQGASYGEAAYESTVVGAWMMVWVGDPLYRPYPAVPAE